MPAKNSGKQRKIEYRRHCIKQLWIEYGIEQLADFKEALKEHYDLEVSVPTISRDLKAIKQRLIETDIDELKAYLKANYKFIVVEAYDAWRDSRKDKQTITNEAIEGGSGSSGERIKAQERTEGQSGNPALLAQAQAALKAIRELIGTDAATKHEHSGPAGGPIIMVNWDGTDTTD